MSLQVTNGRNKKLYIYNTIFIGICRLKVDNLILYDFRTFWISPATNNVHRFELTNFIQMC